MSSALRAFCQNALEDFRRRVRTLLGVSLDPLQAGVPDPLDGWPATCHPITLQGYFGETLAALMVERFPPFAENGWQVPGYLFRFHVAAFQQLEKLRQTCEQAKAIPGRTGDDCLAFQRDARGSITKALVCEAKCTSRHASSLLSDAHCKLSEPLWKPVDLPQLIEVLMASANPDAASWIAPLRRLWLAEDPPANYERYDYLVYVCGRKPRARTAWLERNRAHRRYTANRRLEVVEVHFVGVSDLIQAVYGPEESTE